MNAKNAVTGIEVTGPVSAEFSQILTPEALAFVGGLARKFGTRRKELLDRRQQVQAEIDAGKHPDFLPETRAIRD
ncbi:MAG: malate synthase A, partial [Desulfobacterales bacterium]